MTIQHTPRSAKSSTCSPQSLPCPAGYRRRVEIELLFRQAERRAPPAPHSAAITEQLFEPALVTGTDGNQQQVTGDGEAHTAVNSARRLAAAERGHNEVRTERLLFVIALDPGSAARRVLNDLGVEIAEIKKVLAGLIPARLPRRRRLGKGRTGRACSFCGCTDPDRAMVAGPGVWICGECVQLSADILDHRPANLRAG